MSATASPCAVAWSRLDAEAARLRAVPVPELFAREPARYEALSCEAGGLHLDYSRQHVDAGSLQALIALADAAGLRGWIDAMFRGDAINTTESRPALHVALRQPAGAGVGGVQVERQVLAERQRVLAFAEAVRDGRVQSSSGHPFRTIINIGIGGSDLGPAMAVEALRMFRGQGPEVAFVSNVDGCALTDRLETADPRTTLFVVASKTFTTQETMANAAFARRWLSGHLGAAAVPAHFAAVSVNTSTMDRFGVHPDYRFTMWDWVGGRYSVWSSIGVSLAIAVGREHFEAFLGGARRMDEHFASAPWATNLPVLMALLGAWNINLLKLPTLAILPYDSRLARFPAFLQQLDMESNGKRVDRDGALLVRETAPIVWGEPGNNAQHSFFQLLHQGTARAALDFLLPARSSCGNEAQQRLAIANCLAQADVLMRGQDGSGVVAHKVQEGSRPASLLMFQRLDPAILGALVALYEHKVFTQSVLWGINAFDQWGVELGKNVAESVLDRWAGGGASPPPGDALAGTMRTIRALRGFD